jgi:DNA replication initiation complex subunit (GINS family)
MLTYADIQRIYRLEKNSTSLQNIPDSFYPEVKLLISKIDEEHRSYIKKITRELYTKRKQKILLHAIRDEEAPGNLTREEKQLYSGILNLLENYEHKIFSDEILPRVMEEKKIEEIKETQKEEQKESEIESKEEINKEVREEHKEIEEETNTIKLKILEALPAIVGFDSISYGPFSENQEVNLPKEIAKILIEKGVAERL